MMYWYEHGPGGWGWIAMTIGMVAFWAVIIAAVVVLIRALTRKTASGTDVGTGIDAEHILAERFARGEIDEQEYRERLNALRTIRTEAPKT